MKYEIVKLVTQDAEPESVGEIHLEGPIDAYACGLAYEDYDTKKTTKELTCITCITFLEWAKSVSKLKG